jgi:uncharacterized protein YjbI with pentapeptide repeats
LRFVAADKIVSRGAGVSLSGTEDSQRGARLSGTLLSGNLMPADAPLHGASLGGALGLADPSLRGASLGDTLLLAGAWCAAFR